MIISIIFILLITLGIGLPIVLLLVPRLNKLAIVGLSYPIGIGLFTFFIFVTNTIGIRFGFTNELIHWGGVSLPLIFLTRKKLKSFYIEAVRDFKRTNLQPIEKIMLAVLAFLAITSFINTLYWPVHMWDSLVLYDFRGHVFANTGFMGSAFIDGYYYNYPLLTSLAHAIVYLSGGSYPQFLYSAFYLSLILILYGFLREFTSRKVSFFGALILALTGPLFYHSLFSYTNLTYTVYLAIGAISIFLWDRKKERGYLILSALMVGLSTWVRSNEPFWAAVLLIVFLISIYRKKVWDFALYGLFILPIREVWKVYQNHLNGSSANIVSEISGYGSILSHLFELDRWAQVATYLFKYAVTPWGGIFAGFVLATVAVFLLKKQKSLFLLFFIVFVFLAVMLAGTFFFSLTAENWYRIGDAAERLSMLFYPLFIYAIALTISQNEN